MPKGYVSNQIEAARDGAEEFRFLFEPERTELPAVVLLDLKLPKIDGLDVLSRIRSQERTRLLPVVVLTSSSEEMDRVKSYQLGANSYVRKPVEFDEFANALRQLGLYRLLLNEPPLGVD